MLPAHRTTVYSMKILDGDEQRIRNSSGQLASRDLVQFVPMRDFETRGAMALAKEVKPAFFYLTTIVTLICDALAMLYSM
jgi:Copine